MHSLETLKPSEAAVVDKIVAAMGPAELRNYETYLDGRGFTPEGVGQIIIMQALARMGWITRAPSMTNNEAVWLTKSAWDLFGLDEWDEIKDEETPDWGSWA